VKEVAEKLDHLAAHSPADDEVGKQPAGVVEVWDLIIGALPEWQNVIAGTSKPGDVREKYVFAHGLGWQAIAIAAASIIRSDPNGWDQTLTDALKKINWSRMVTTKDETTGEPKDVPNPVWQSIAMVGTRVNNTAPGSRPRRSTSSSRRESPRSSQSPNRGPE
jgi:DNA sulfur modification protein DndB